MSAKITLCLGLFYIFIGTSKGFGAPVNSASIALFSFTAACFSLVDLFNEIKLKNRTVMHSVEGVTGFALICSLLSLSFTTWFERYKDHLVAIGDVATIVGFGIFLITIGNKEKKFFQNLLQKKTPFRIDFSVVSNMISQEYTVFLNINKSIEELKKIDKNTFSLNRVHTGWGEFYDSFLNYDEIGPFFDSYNNKLFRKFIRQINVVADTINTISDASPHTSRTVGTLTIWGYSTEIQSTPALKHSVPPHITDVIEKLNEALETWEKLRKEVTDRHQKN